MVIEIPYASSLNKGGFAILYCALQIYLLCYRKRALYFNAILRQPNGSAGVYQARCGTALPFVLELNTP